MEFDAAQLYQMILLGLGLAGGGVGGTIGIQKYKNRGSNGSSNGALLAGIHAQTKTIEDGLEALRHEMERGNDETIRQLAAMFVNLDRLKDTATTHNADTQAAAAGQQATMAVGMTQQRRPGALSWLFGAVFS